MYRKRYRRHRNPISMSGVKGVLVPAAMGAAGAVVIDYAYNFVSPYVPSALTSFQYSSQLIKLALAFGLGIGARKVLGSDKGNAVLAGAVTVTLYNVLASALGGTPGMAGLAAYMKTGMGAYQTNPATYITRPGMGRIGRVGAYMKTGLSGLPFGGMGSLAGATSDVDYGMF